MPIPRYKLPLISWGATQANGSKDSTALTLAATGLGVYAPVDAHETVHQGALAYDTDTDVYFWLYYSLIPFTYDPFFRVQDVTNGVTIIHAVPYPAGQTNFMRGIVLDNPWPAGNARLELQYSLTATYVGTLKFYVAGCEAYLWP